ncbi:NgoMIV family type II restriction endonuclease [Myceligenerans xiligouense]|uniref:NgoMIV restriction enzyme n=1 Tax=Myceligenerans xiligouense TaxID=253184 RepID=A0A3N4YJV0_9MICO|nr:NgoMIV family type II restriction endonuclease [Myceligenerans xiligouense]RPF20377.1 NgoMIV restriction enzyme [Myceligenerans xiligouense]
MTQPSFDHDTSGSRRVDDSTEALAESPVLLAQERREFHASLLASGTLTVDRNGVPSNADKQNSRSVMWAQAIANKLKVETVNERAAGQTSGNTFEDAVAAYLNSSFPALSALRPGDWDIRKITGRNASGVSQFEQYRHLADLDRAVKADPMLRASLGNAYVVAPDVIIARNPVSDAVLNAGTLLVDESVATHASLRCSVQPDPILHSVVSCKWTLRSDRAQNARTEALNLIRNRKGQVPHIVVVTGEPTLSRISSLALGTGDIDTVYHFALYELETAVRASGDDEHIALLDSMVDGRRLKDISDLPLDLAI